MEVECEYPRRNTDVSFHPASRIERGSYGGYSRKDEFVHRNHAITGKGDHGGACPEGGNSPRSTVTPASTTVTSLVTASIVTPSESTESIPFLFATNLHESCKLGANH
jgi:hypothetical protein